MQKHYDFSSNQIIFGIGAVEKIHKIVSDRNIRQVLIVTDKFMASSGLIDHVLVHLDKAGVGHKLFTEFEPNPTESDAENCGVRLVAGDYDAVLGFGGGSSIDVAKAASVLAHNSPPIKQYFGLDNVPKPGLTIIAIPTTSGTGSEATNICVLRDAKANTKGGIVSPRIIPDVAIVDPMLTLTLPAGLTATTGMDALCHAVEGFTSRKATPFSDLFHREAIRLVAANLRTAVNKGDDLEARSSMSLAALMTGVGLVTSSATCGHALSYSIEGNFHVSHGDSCAALLPSVARFNAIAEMKKFKEIAILMGEDVSQLT
ncbi:MAG: iron-containing alcohol dehydrogenase, partial [Desulfofustis sp.]|nr:iron-containing alcohol dehydrogenase [Desulfofustis sp.]